MTMTIRMLCTGILFGAVGTIAAAQDTQFHLASAQVVIGGNGVATLKLAADGPVAVAVEPELDGTAAAPNRLRLRLYGVTPTSALASQSVSPFAIQANTEGRDTILVIAAGDLPPNARLELGQALRSSELLIVVR